MTRLTRLSVSIVVAAAMLAIAPLRAEAGKGATGYNCKSDRVVDAPMQFVVDTQSAARLHLSAYGGSDKSPSLSVATWTLYDGSGHQIDYFPKSLLVWVSPAMLNDANVEGLVPGASYVVELTSKDWCNNQAKVRKSVTMPVSAPEQNPPTLSNPGLVSVGLQGPVASEIQFSVTDDSGIVDVEVYVNGTLLKQFQYGDGASFRWWFDDYPYDNTQSTLEGPNYYISYPSTYTGQAALVEVVTVDLYGNRTVTSAVLYL